MPRKLRFSLRSVLLVVAICALILWWLRPEVLDPGYFPIGVGYRWVYASTAGNAQDDVVFEVVGTEKVGEAECFVVLRTIGDHQITFYVEVTNRGVFLHKVGEDRYQPAYRQFAFSTKQGDSWNWHGKIGNEPSNYECFNDGLWPFRVPLGEWDAFHVHQRFPANGADTYFSLVDGIGVVRIYSKSRDKHDPPRTPSEPDKFDWQLKEFSRP